MAVPLVGVDIGSMRTLPAIRLATEMHFQAVELVFVAGVVHDLRVEVQANLLEVRCKLVILDLVTRQLYKPLQLFRIAASDGFFQTLAEFTVYPAFTSFLLPLLSLAVNLFHARPRIFLGLGNVVGLGDLIHWFNR